MDRFSLLAPALLILAAFVSAFTVYCGLCAIGKPPVIAGVKHNQLFGLFFARFICWLLFPLERLLVGRVSPNAITAASLLGCVATGVAAALGHLAWALWLFVLSGILDVLDGRLARITNKQTQSGALFDSVSDRWGELIVFSGYAYFLDTVWLPRCWPRCGSMMVTTRVPARKGSASLTAALCGRRRIFITTIGTLIAACSAQTPTGHDGDVLGGTMLLPVSPRRHRANRWIVAYRVLARRDAEAAGSVMVSKVEASQPVVKQPAVVSEPLFAPVPKALRESAELPL